MPQSLTLHIEGEDAEQVSEALQNIFQTHFQQSVEVHIQKSNQPEANQKSPIIDALAVMSFVLSVPGFFLAMETLIDRTKNKDKLKDLAKQSSDVIGSHDATIWVVVDGKPYQLNEQNTHAIYEAFAKQKQQ